MTYDFETAHEYAMQDADSEDINPYSEPSCALCVYAKWELTRADANDDGEENIGCSYPVVGDLGSNPHPARKPGATASRI